MSQLEAIEGMTSCAVTGNAHPLCTERVRVLIFTSFDSKHSAQQLADDYQRLAEKVASKLKKHHFKTFLTDTTWNPSGPAASDEQDPTKIAQTEAKYKTHKSKMAEIESWSQSDVELESVYLG